MEPAKQGLYNELSRRLQRSIRSPWSWELMEVVPQMLQHLSSGLSPDLVPYRGHEEATRTHVVVEGDDQRVPSKVPRCRHLNFAACACDIVPGFESNVELRASPPRFQRQKECQQSGGTTSRFRLQRRDKHSSSAPDKHRSGSLSCQEVHVVILMQGTVASRLSWGWANTVVNIDFAVSDMANVRLGAAQTT